MVFRGIEVRDDERIDDLQFGDLFVLQKKNGYSFSSDAVLLANFTKCHAGDRYVDLCSGCGVVGILATAKQKPKNTKLIEIQSHMAEMAERSIAICGLNEKIESVCMRVQDTSQIISDGSVDVVSVNPPYYRMGEGRQSENPSVLMARHESEITLEEIVKETSRMLKLGGELFMIHLTDRFSEVLDLLGRNSLTPAEVRFVYPKPGADSKVFLVRAKKRGRGKLKVLSPIYSTDSNSAIL